MTSSARQQLLSALMCAGGFFALFGKSIGLPAWTEEAGALFAIACAVTTIILRRRRAKKHADPSFLPATAAQNRKYTWLLVVVLFMSFLGWAFVPPNMYSGVSWPLGKRLIMGGVFFIVLTPLIIVTRRRREKT